MISPLLLMRSWSMARLWLGLRQLHWFLFVHGWSGNFCCFCMSLSLLGILLRRLRLLIRFILMRITWKFNWSVNMRMIKLSVITCRNLSQMEIMPSWKKKQSKALKSNMITLIVILFIMMMKNPRNSQFLTEGKILQLIRKQTPSTNQD